MSRPCLSWEKVSQRAFLDRCTSECVAKLFAALRERNYRIRPNSTSNRYCARALVLESILLNLVVKIVLQHIPSESGRGFDRGERQLRAPQVDIGPSIRSKSFPAPENFFLQERLPQKGYPPFWGRTVFGQVFGRGGMSNFQNPKVPPGGSHLPPHIQARLRCAEPCQFRPALPATGANLISPEVAEPVG